LVPDVSDEPFAFIFKVSESLEKLLINNLENISNEVGVVLIEGLFCGKSVRTEF
jgi:hypothetical protein